PEFVLVQAPSLPPKPQLKKNITSNTDNVDEITKVSVPTSKKEKQSLKLPSQDEQSCLEKIIEKRSLLKSLALLQPLFLARS
ncbi:38606_t:CDS:2, partial [Gigaspora margarita]